MILREFKEVFSSKPCDMFITIYSTDNVSYKFSKEYECLNDFYDDDFLDSYLVNFFMIHNEEIFISLNVSE
jgi:hypothetical protein